MKLELQKPCIKIINFGERNIRRRRLKHGPRWPETIRGLLIGPSGCGKTTILVSLLLDEFGPRYKNLYVYSKTLFQEKIRYLKRVLRKIKRIGYFEFSNKNKVIHPSRARPFSIMIFDDLASDDIDIIKQYFTMGRQFGLDTFFLCQSYTSSPKNGIRDNANFLIIFRQDELSLHNIYKNHVIGDMKFKKFLEICAECWRDNEFGFLVIDKYAGINSGRYRVGFNHNIIL